MASVETTNNPNDPNNPNAAGGASAQSSQAPQGQTNQPATTGGAGAVTATGAGNVTGQVVGTANPSQPFQNISSYLAANAPQSEQLASQVASTVSQPITQAQNSIQSAADTFTKGVSSGFNAPNQDLINAVAANPAYVVAENPQNVQNFLGQLNNAYTGPTDFTQAPGYSDLEAQIANAQSQAAATQTPAGIQTLLNSVEGPTTAGINKLDSLLLTNNPQNITNIQEAGAPAANLPGTLTNTTQTANAAAAQGAKTASDTKAAAAKALQDALTAESGNLSNQQNTIQGIVDEYNKSVGIINPVTQAIASDIQNYLAANPNLSLSNATDALAPLMNLTSLNMPSESTYASPYDYQTIAALAQLGLDPSALAGLPINASTKDLAQTFQIPTALQNAVGQAPGVESALSNELNTLGGEITKAYQPYQDLMNAEMRRADTVQQVKDLSAQLDRLNQTTANVTPTADQLAQKNALQAQIAALEKSPDYVIPNYWPQISQLGQSLQWLSPASSGYNDLVTAINAELGKLGNVGVPTLNYAPTTLTDPVTGVPIGTVGKDLGNATGIATGAGAAGAAGVGEAAGIGAAEAASAADLAAEMGVTPEAAAALQAGEAGASTTVAPAIGAALNTAGPAALAAYGASNVVQNSLAHPIESGLSTLANTGLSLATLSLPPQVFESIGKNLTNVINSIGNFFGGLF